MYQNQHRSKDSINQPNMSSSTTTVEQLYAKFQNLKTRITNNDNKRSSRSIDRKNYLLENRRDHKYRKLANFQPIEMGQGPLIKPNNITQTEKQSQKKIIDLFVIQQLKSIQNYYSKKIAQITQNHSKKVDVYLKKFIKLEKKLIELKKTIRNNSKNIIDNGQKNNYSFSQKNNDTTCNTFKSLSENNIQANKKVSQIQKKYKEQIQSIIQSYESKILVLIQQNTSTKKSESDSLSQNNTEKKQVTNTLQKLNQSLQEKLLSKEKEITDLNIDNNKLKRMLEQSKMNFQRNVQLNGLLKEENKILENAIQKLETFKKQAEIDKKSGQIQLEKLKGQVKTKNNEIKKLNQSIQRLNRQIIESRQINHNKSKKIDVQQIKKSNLQTSENPLTTFLCPPADKVFELQSINTDRSEQQNQQVFLQEEYIDDLTTQEPNLLKHCSSLVFNKQNQNVRGLRVKQKQLTAEINLLEQQNKLLKFKKDKFQEQLKKSQQDEERFQQQGQINKIQIRRLNIYCQRLDQCGVRLLKGEPLSIQMINSLQQESKMREQYHKMKDSKQKRGLSIKRLFS